MKIKDKLFGISTKNLVVAELVRSINKKSNYDIKPFSSSYVEFNPPVYILAKKKNEEYKDIFTKHKYEDVNCNDKQSNILAKQILPCVSLHSKRIKYSDADSYVKQMNEYVIKKKK